MRKKIDKKMAVLIGISICMVFLVVVILWSARESWRELDDYVDNVYPDAITHTPTEPVRKPTDVSNGIAPGIEESPLGVAERLEPYILEKNYPYNGTAAGIMITRKTLPQIAGIEKTGEKITLKEVGAGDIGVFGEHQCVCVGFDTEGNAVFAYASSYDSPYMPEGGIYLGYSMEQKDALYYGMYPVPIEVYYDCSEEQSDVSRIQVKAAEYEKTISEYAVSLYETGRAFSNADAERIADMFPAELMLEHNVKVVPEELRDFLSSFPVFADAPDMTGGYCFREKSSYRLSSREYMRVELVSLSSDSYLMCKGEWDVTTDSGVIIPFVDFKLYDFVGRGFCRAKDTTYYYDENGDLSGYEFSDTPMPGTIVENEDGTRTYIGAGYEMDLAEDENIVEENERIISLGNGRYLLLSRDGASCTYDMTTYADLSEEQLFVVLEQLLIRLDAGLVELNETGETAN